MKYISFYTRNYEWSGYCFLNLPGADAATLNEHALYRFYFVLDFDVLVMLTLAE